MQDTEGICYAVSEGNLSLVRKLLAEGANVNCIVAGQPSALPPPLYLASARGHLELVVELIRAGANLDGENTGYASPLRIAAERGHAAVIHELIRAGAQVNHLSGTREATPRTALMSASEQGQIDAVNALLHAGADVSTTMSNGLNALDVAVEKNKVEIAAILLRAGSHINWRAIYNVVRSNDLAMLQELLRHGADIKGKDSLLDAVRPAAGNGIDIKYAPMVLALVQAGAQDADGLSGYAWARHGNLEIVSRLVLGGTNSNRFLMAYLGAASTGQLAVLRWLFDVSKSPALLSSALSHACHANQAEAVRAILMAAAASQMKLEVNEPLLVACDRNFVHVSEALLDADASPNFVDKLGRPLLHIAVTQNHVALTRLLLAAGANPDAIMRFQAQ
ncbi:hypothetical protein, variant [Capsaspora owczarzaki ATCC 30864]|uniref:Uncharacterized protein n=2 Tax=Capsaspora owczarzaki (strain ATCC 30864) TaxID=595528 RepID=A0A0D2WIQ7_CAPO3|nr:hypothetical protein CAOG_000557 [Capsaspora owczarzaki ATCC 30864]KJE88994.1 hypothetical protein, variant [Capsaspora owczarzaki ATCC 30864]